VAVVEADVEARACRAGDQVDGRIAACANNLWKWLEARALLMKMF
jgi:hypothetical protein